MIDKKIFELDLCGEMFLESIVDVLNSSRILYLDTKDKKYWWRMIQLYLHRTIREEQFR